MGGIAAIGKAVCGQQDPVDLVVASAAASVFRDECCSGTETYETEVL
jgi:hypothetical protein